MAFYLFADAKPSETLKKQKNHPAGLAAACILPHKNGVPLLEVPVKQYKDYNTRRKEAQAVRLAEWLRREREENLHIRGFLLARSLTAAARYAIDIVEELPNARVEPHYDSYRLLFGDEVIDFPQALALAYYYFSAVMGCLQAWKGIAEGEQKHLAVFFDRFPAVSSGPKAPGVVAPKTQGMKFLEFIRANSATAIGIHKQEAESGVRTLYTTLEWWKDPRNDNALVAGKDHPHFALVDWLVAGALANSFKEEFIAEYPNRRRADHTANALIELYQEFKNFNVWEIADDNTLDHIKGSDKLWEVPDDARKYVMDNAVGHKAADLT